MDFTGILNEKEIQISMDSRGRALDNVFIERLWRNLKYEEVYRTEYIDVADCYHCIKEYFRKYNQERLHQSLDYRTPEEVHYNLAYKFFGDAS